jgi:hypothetical protein
MDPVETVRTILAGTAERFRLIRVTNGLGPAPGSPAAQELEAQGQFAVPSMRQPVENCYGIAVMRLIAAADHLDSTARLLADPAQVYGQAITARAALETSARAWWALDPNLDLRTRVVRGMVDRMLSLQEGGKVPIRKLRAHQEARLDELVAVAEELEFRVRRDLKGRPISIAGVAPPGATELIKKQEGKIGEVSYRILSAVAHGVLYGLMTSTEIVAPVVGQAASFVMPVFRVESVAPFAAISVLSFVHAFGRQVRLFGWNAPEFAAWWGRAAEEMKGILRGATPPSAD